VIISPVAFYADILSFILTFITLDEIIICCQINLHWHYVSQRYSYLLQLQNNDFPLVNAYRYPEWLKSLKEYSCHLVMAEQKNEHWRKLNLSKERQSPRHQFVMADGCRTMRTVELKFVKRSDTIYDANELLPLLGKGTAFLSASELKLTGEEKPHDIKQLQQKIQEVAIGLEQKTKIIESRSQIEPETTSDGFITPALSNKYLQFAINVYRKYFSPDLYYIFPLIVYRKAELELDFSDTQTWVIFKKAEPVGAITFRIHKPIINSAPSHAVPPKPVLEVIFIAVLEEHRHSRYGTKLVQAVEGQAKSERVSYLYVEIGMEQHLAAQFWTKKNQFSQIESLGIPWYQQVFIDSTCLRFNDTAQFMKEF